ncbi:hypothetical protein GGTG_02265 [Gaeumannomyces tritici R3-111a-1]|uniref:Uncharacterized protein n=1 Tax=Gaeumannomyces tritici (strain R3-111a-1) TaxID=644352 RepID=J3NLW1_GAET3|nr:hypothetical protein GGTG_02265 [Gaeumannomyces tritici R3-111a-1]EJT82291.1 hypothetical protein GGTG_02265 [Gaeumannomyces tritici R3-111a-1]
MVGLAGLAFRLKLSQIYWKRVYRIGKIPDFNG